MKGLSMCFDSTQVDTIMLAMRNAQAFAGASNPRIRKSVDMDSLAAGSLRSEYKLESEFRKMLFSELTF
jgi:hypothetical protein